jgi:hypothetical protein
MINKALPYYLIDDISEKNIYEKSIEVYHLFSSGLRQILIEKHLNIPVDDSDYISASTRKELEFVAEAILLFFLIEEELQPNFQLSDTLSDVSCRKERFEEITSRAFIDAFEEELEEFADDTVNTRLQSPQLDKGKCSTLGFQFPIDIIFSLLSDEGQKCLELAMEFDNSVY